MVDAAQMSSRQRARELAAEPLAGAMLNPAEDGSPPISLQVELCTRLILAPARKLQDPADEGRAGFIRSGDQ